MEYKRFGDTVVARMDRGEDIIEQVKVIALAENIKLAEITALGAASEFTVGVFRPLENRFQSNDFKGDFEISSIVGTINTMNGEYYSHLHMTASDPDGKTVGGHLTRAIVSMTCEMVIRIIGGTVDRVYNEELHINQLKF